jgi:multidrug resistance efflux pump
MAAVTFNRTLRSLESEKARSWISGLLVASTILGLWILWFFLGRVPIHEVTDQARIEVELSAHPVAAEVTGRVLTSALGLGRPVKKGEVLVELDPEAARLALEESRVRIAAIGSSLAALSREIEACKEADAAHTKAGEASLEEARARVQETEARWRFSESKFKTVETLRAAGSVSVEDLQQARMEMDSDRAALDARRLAVLRLAQETEALERDRRAAIAKLEVESVELRGQEEAERAAVRRLEREIELHRVRAPIDGAIGKAGDLRVGSVVRPADELASIVPSGPPRVVALFPTAAIGRIRKGQQARLRLHGFPWTRFGTPLAVVTDVGNEPRDGLVRVELDLLPDSAPAIPLEHGLPANVEVEVERLVPAELVLRTVGKWLTTRPSAPPGPSAGRSEAGTEGPR